VDLLLEEKLEILNKQIDEKLNNIQFSSTNNLKDIKQKIFQIEKKINFLEEENYLTKN